MLGVRLPTELETQLDYVAHLSKRSKSSIVKELLRESRSLEDLADYYLALERLEQHRLSGSKTSSLAEIAQKYALDDDA